MGDRKTPGPVLGDDPVNDGCLQERLKGPVDRDPVEPLLLEGFHQFLLRERVLRMEEEIQQGGPARSHPQLRIPQDLDCLPVPLSCKPSARNPVHGTPFPGRSQNEPSPSHYRKIGLQVQPGCMRRGRAYWSLPLRAVTRLRTANSSARGTR